MTNQIQTPTIINREGTSPSPQADIQLSGVGSNLPSTPGIAQGIAREEAELKAAIVLARANPRDATVAWNDIMHSCQRPTFAQRALYKFPRGGTSITGPSVDLAREMARCWGNVRYGFRIVSIDEEHVHIKGFANDLQTNNYVEVEDSFDKAIQRRQRDGSTLWIKPDERDLRELVNRRGAIAERNAILKLMPPDVIDEAQEKCREVQVAAARGDLQTSRETAIRNIVSAFDGLSVSIEMLETKLGHALKDVDEQEIAELRAVYKSIGDGNSKREEYFKIGSDPVKKERSTSKRVASKLRDGKKEE